MNAMKKELYDSFKKICVQAKEISGMPELSPSQIDKIVLHVSNSDMETTIRTISHAYHMIKTELEGK